MLQKYIIFSSSIVKSFCIPLRHLFYSCFIFFLFRILGLSAFLPFFFCLLNFLWAIEQRKQEFRRGFAGVSCVLFSFIVSRAHFYCFQNNIKSSFYSLSMCFAIDENEKCERRRKKNKKNSFSSSTQSRVLLQERHSRDSSWMNTKTTYFKILNTNCAEKKKRRKMMKLDDRARAVEWRNAKQANGMGGNLRF